VATKHEIVLAIVGGLFVLEAVSVMVQVASFKLTGKRVFRMAPIHHHFEQLGWSESQIVVRFWIIAFVLALISQTLVMLAQAIYSYISYVLSKCFRPLLTPHSIRWHLPMDKQLVPALIFCWLVVIE
jgi:hypothetical protein